MLQVSRTTVRDALKVLKGKGLITVSHGRGVFIAEPENQTQATKRVADVLLLQKAPVSDLFEMREVLETEAVAWAVKRANRQEIDEIVSVYTEYKSRLDNGKLSGVEANQYDSELHRLIAVASRNSVLLQTMSNLRILLDNSRKISISIPSRRFESVEEMGRIVNAIENGAVKNARSEMLSHLRNGKKAHALAMSKESAHSQSRQHIDKSRS